jgi:ribonuclease HI
MKKLKIVTDANCHRTTFYKSKSTGAAQFYDAINGELVHQEEFVLGDMTPYSAECETLVRALDVACGLTRQSTEVCSDSETLVRQLNGDYLLKARSAKYYFDKIKQMEMRFIGGVQYFHHSRETSLAKAAHTAAAGVFAKHHVE